MTTTHTTKHPEHPDGWTRGPTGTKVLRTLTAARADKAAHPVEHSGLKIWPPLITPPPAADEADEGDAGEEQDDVEH